MTLTARPDLLHDLADRLDEAADLISTHTCTVGAMSTSTAAFGVVNQFMTPVLNGFIQSSRFLASECAQQLRLGAVAARETGDDMVRIDAWASRMMGGEGSPCQ